MIAFKIEKCQCGSTDVITKIDGCYIYEVCKGCGRVKSKRSWMD